MGAAAAVAIMRRREREVVDDFRAAGAISPARAQSYTAIGLGESMALRRLHDRAVIRESAPGLWYLDEEVWTAVNRTRRRVAFSMLALVLMLFAGFAMGLIRR
jgi:hypothetical protein